MFAPQGWKRELRDIADPQAAWAKTKEITLAAEAAGYDSIWVYDHFHNVPKPSHETVFECWTTMAALAEATSRIRLGQMVGCALYRPPALLAKITSNIDVISGGRLEWGIGAGWYRNEFAGYGYEFAEPKERIGRMRGDRRDRDLDVVAARDHLRGEVLPAPAGPVRPQAGAVAPPAGVDRRRRRAADAAGGGPPGRLGQLRRQARGVGGQAGGPQGHCKVVGRDEEEIGKSWSPEVLIRETEAEIRELVAAGRAGSIWGEEFDSWAAGNLVGTPEQVAEKIARYVELGCTYFIPWCTDYPDTDHASLFCRTGHAPVPLDGELTAG